MPLEVEVKIAIDDLEELEYLLVEKGAKLEEIVIQRDHYYTHPTRDYNKTDEALRIREEGNKCYLTYKGPKIDSKSKTRVEIETEIMNYDKMNKILVNLSFHKVIIIVKERKIYLFKGVIFSLDQVETLGSFLEVEKVIDNEDEYLEVQKDIFEKIRIFNLNPENNIRESYMELILSNKVQDKIT
ncbi:MAG: class IV adenylate cyclase [Candidatus Heimdallarchaeota archaeon]|nr:class IV adenylate cyclase [Candidatus Heimdallarchaeota archaeon]